MKNTSTSTHGPASNETALNELVWILPHDLAVLAGARLTLIGIHHEVLGPAIIPVTLHEAPLEPRGKPSTTPAPQARLLDLIEDPVGSLQHNLLGLVPVAPLHGPSEAEVTLPIQISENPVCVLEAPMGAQGAVESGSCAGCQ